MVRIPLVTTVLRPVTAVAAVVAGALLLTACQPVQTAPPEADHTESFGVSLEGKAIKEGGTLVMGLSAEPDKLDPTTSSSLYTTYVMDSICEKLYDVDTQGTIVPVLAAGLPDISADGRTLKISVKEGVKFADGTPMDAEAVKTTFDRNLTMPTSTRRGELGPLERVDVTGPYEVTLRLKTPYAPLTAALTDRAGMILSPKALKDLGDDFGTHPVCVGPMKFVKRVPQTEIDVARDPNYYDAGDVHLDAISYRIMADANIRAANLRSGDIQVADSVSPQDIDGLVKDKNLQVLQSESRGYQSLTFNVGNTDGVGKPTGTIDTPLAKDPRVRHAIELSIDRATLVNSVFNNWHIPTCTPFAHQNVFTDDHPADCAAYDPEKARELLKEAGVEIPYKVQMKTTNTADALRYAAALQASLKAGGINLEIIPVEYSTLLDEQRQGDFEMVALGWSGLIDPDSNVTRFVHTGGGNNYAGYSNPEMDRLLDAGASETDPAKRTEIYRQVTDLLHEDLPLIYAYSKRNLTATTGTVAGVNVYPDGVIRVAKAAFVAESGQ